MPWNHCWNCMNVSVLRDGLMQSWWLRLANVTSCVCHCPCFWFREDMDDFIRRVDVVIECSSYGDVDWSPLENRGGKKHFDCVTGQLRQVLVAYLDQIFATNAHKSGNLMPCCRSAKKKYFKTPLNFCERRAAVCHTSALYCWYALKYGFINGTRTQMLSWDAWETGQPDSGNWCHPSACRTLNEA